MSTNNGSQYDQQHQFNWSQDGGQYPADNAYGQPPVGMQAAGEYVMENKENTNPVQNIGQHGQGLDSMNSSALTIPTSVDGQNNRDLSPHSGEDVFEQVCRLPSPKAEAKVQKTFMDSRVDIESPKRNKSKVYIPKNRTKPLGKRGIVKKCTSSKMSKGKTYRCDSPPCTPILSLSPVWSPTHAEKQKMRTSPQRKSGSTCTEVAMSSISTSTSTALK